MHSMELRSRSVPITRQARGDHRGAPVELTMEERGEPQRQDLAVPPLPSPPSGGRKHPKEIRRAGATPFPYLVCRNLQAPAAARKALPPNPIP